MVLRGVVALPTTDHALDMAMVTDTTAGDDRDDDRDAPVDDEPGQGVLA